MDEVKLTPAPAIPPVTAPTLSPLAKELIRIGIAVLIAFLASKGIDVKNGPAADPPPPAASTQSAAPVVIVVSPGGPGSMTATAKP